MLTIEDKKRAARDRRKIKMVIITKTVFVLAFIVLIYNTIFAQDDISNVKTLIQNSQQKGLSIEQQRNILLDALNIAEKIKYIQGKADILHYLGINNHRRGEYPLALKRYFEELELREKNPGWQNSSLSMVYSSIGETYRAVANYDLSLEFLDKGLKAAEKNNDEKAKSYAYNRYASVYYEMSYRNKDTVSSFKASDYANKSLEIIKRTGDIELELSTLNIIGAVYRFRGNKDSSLAVYTLAYEKCKDDSTYQDKPNILNNMGSLYNSLGDYDKAIKCGMISYEMSKKSGIRVYFIESARMLSDSYAKKGDFKNAYNYLFEGIAQYLDIFTERKTAEVYGLQHKYETDIREKEEGSNTLRRAVAAGGFILIILFLGLIYYLKHKNQKRINAELAAKNEMITKQTEQLAETNASKDKFFSILTHDLKNPLTGMLGFTDILTTNYDSLSEQDKKAYINYLKTSSESLYLLIEKILIWSRAQTGKIEMSKENIDLMDTAEAVVELQHVNAIRKGIKIENYIHDGIIVSADRNILDTVLRNLVDNAIKFTNSGGKVSIYAERNDNNVTISIKDNGVGIDEKSLKDLFNIGTVVKTVGTKNEKGTGLGLYICKDMLSLMGTVLKVESKKDEGTRFYFSVPVAKTIKN
jgi:signal transduction histidine kinase